MNYPIGKEKKTMYICSMKQRIYRIRNKRLVQGDSNLLDTNEILVKEDEVGVRLLSREGSEVKDIAYNPADKPVVPEDPYENVIWGKVHYNLEEEAPDGHNGNPYIVFPYTTKYRYVFFIRKPTMAIKDEFDGPVDIDVHIHKRKDDAEIYRATGIKYDTLYFCDTEGNVSEVPAGKTYRVRNCGGELLDTVNNEFMSSSIKTSVPLKEINNGFIKANMPVKHLGVRIDTPGISGLKTVYFYLYKKNRLSPKKNTQEPSGIVGLVDVIIYKVHT